MDVLIEFIEVAIHCILYNRELYPQGVFEKRTKYKIPVQMCLHPDVNSYINSILDSLKILLSKGVVHKVSVVVLQEDTMRPLERFVFEISKFCNSASKDPHLFDVEQALRGFLLKLNVSDALLKDCRKDNTWTVHVHTQDSTLLAVEEELVQKEFPWLKAEVKEEKMKNPRLVPLRSSSTELFNIQLYVEEESDVR